MGYGLKPLGREKLSLWLMLTPTLIGLPQAGVMAVPPAL